MTTDTQKLPWMAWDIPAYMGDTIGFKVEHHGAYLLLLAAVWMGKGRLKFASMEDLQDTAHCTPEQWERVQAKVLAKFDVDEDGCLTQKRLAEEWARAGVVRGKRKLAGKAGGEAKAKRLAEAKQNGSKPGSKPVANAKQKGRPTPTPLHSSTNVEDPLGQPAADPTDERPTAESVFAALWLIYPKRAGGDSRADAFKAFEARRKAGQDATAIYAGLKRYVAYCDAAKKTGTQFVMRGATFFGPGLHYLSDFALPPAAHTSNAQHAASGARFGTQPSGEPPHATHQQVVVDVQARFVDEDGPCPIV